VDAGWRDVGDARTNEFALSRFFHMDRAERVQTFARMSR
jgi:hypothetical protein